MRFYLGTHEVSQRWWDASVPLFVSRVRLEKRKRFPQARAPWALDSGAFSELSKHGRWRMSAEKYIWFVNRLEAEMEHLQWVAPQDWMCEPEILEKTGLTVMYHQRATIENFLELREALGSLVIPVLQGWTQEQYHGCVELYDREGVDLYREDVVGLGTVCRRQGTVEAGRIVRSLDGLKLHGFGVKTTGLHFYGDQLVSADSMAWSYDARRAPALYGCDHKNCANCLRYALRWREQIENGLRQERMFP